MVAVSNSPYTPVKPSKTVRAVSFNQSAPLYPQPMDALGLAHWLGTSPKVLWYLILHRKKLYKEYYIPKPDGTKRVIRDPGDKLKWFQNMALERILSKFKVEDHFGAYAEGRGVAYTAARHAGHKVILELDIKDFFGSTTRRMVREFFKGSSWPREPAHLIADLFTYPVSQYKSVVPQGAPSSPALCNLIANQRFDQAILSFLRATGPGWVYTRYSDNIFISHPEEKPREEVDVILQEVKNLVAAGGFVVHPKKMHIMRSSHPKRPQEMLGLTVNVKPNIPYLLYRKLRAQVRRAETIGFKAVTGVPHKVTTPDQTLAYMRGVINYYNYISQSTKMDRLKQRFETAARRYEEIKQQEGISLAQLRERAKRPQI